MLNAGDWSISELLRSVFKSFHPIFQRPPLALWMAIHPNSNHKSVYNHCGDRFTNKWQKNLAPLRKET